MKRIVAVCLVMALTGCTSFSRAPAERASLMPPPPLAPEMWPARDPAVVEATALPRVSEMYTVHLTRYDGSGDARVVSAADTSLSRVHYNGVAGQGVLRVYDDLGTPDARVGARFVSSWHLARPVLGENEVRARLLGRDGERTLSTSAPARTGGPPQPPKAMRAKVEDLPTQGVSIALPRQSISPTAQRTRGLVLFFDGVLTSAYERPLIRTLESRGWAVVTINTVTAMRRQAEPVRIRTPEDIGPAAREIAEGVDEALAESAYAAEAVLEYLAAERPDVPQRPLILVGCAIGACAVPPTAARLGERVDGAILIGGGANMLDIAMRSDAGNFGVEVDWGETPQTIERHTELLLEYLKASRLDPYHTAAYLVHKPVLAVHAVFDGIVPASAGRLLYTRLGSPDRLRFSGGQLALMYMMDDVAPQIATWLDTAMYNARDGFLTGPVAAEVAGPRLLPAARRANDEANPKPEDSNPAAPKPSGKTGGAKKAAVIDLD